MYVSSRERDGSGAKRERNGIDYPVSTIGSRVHNSVLCIVLRGTLYVTVMYS